MSGKLKIQFSYVDIFEVPLGKVCLTDGFKGEECSEIKNTGFAACGENIEMRKKSSKDKITINLI